MAEGDTFIIWQDGETDRRLMIAPMGICSIGRETSNHIILAEPSVSREHAIIRRGALGQCKLTDLGSTNGTLLDGRPVTAPTVIADGSVISIGGQRLVLRQLLQPEPFHYGSPMQGTMPNLEQAIVTVAVIDVRNFTPLSEQLGAEKLGLLMGRLFKLTGAALHDRGCWSIKFIGDAIMALWNHGDGPVPPAEIANILDALSELEVIFAAVRKEAALPLPLRFGVGINSGPASLGNLGHERAADFTALGETVNIAFRLESATKQQGCDILVGAETFARLAPAIDDVAEQMREISLKGVARPIAALPLNFGSMAPLTAALIRAGSGDRL